MVEGILNTALGFWNMMFGLISNFLGMDPVEFGKDGVWSVISGINGSLQAIGLALIPIFFMFGMIKASATYIEMKRPEAIGKAIVRFCISWAVIVFGMQLLMWIWTVCQGLINRILVTSGFQNTDLTIPAELKNQLDHAGFFNSILLWILAAIGTLIIMVLHLSPLQPLPESLHKKRESALSEALPPFVWKARLLFWLVSFFPYLPQRPYSQWTAATYGLLSFPT